MCTDVVASVAVQKAPKEGDYEVSLVLEYMFKAIQIKIFKQMFTNEPSVK